MINSNKSLKSFMMQQLQTLRSKGKATASVSEHFAEIGSTEIEDIPYNLQLELKRSALRKIFQGVLDEKLLSKIDIDASPKTEEYRFKMDFVASYDPFHEPHARFGQRKKNIFSWVVDINSCILIPDEWFKATKQVYQFIQSLGIRNYDLVKKDGILRYLTIKVYDKQAMLSITINENLSADIKKSIAAFAQSLSFKSIYFLLNDTVRDDSAGEIVGHYGSGNLSITLRANNTPYVFNVGPLTFFQNNIYTFELILDYIVKLIDTYDLGNRDLYDLYCGIGIFSIIYSKYFNKSVGIDIDQNNIIAANQNAVENDVSNVDYLQLDLNSDLSNVQGRLLSKAVAIVDPPRNGLQAQGVAHILALRPSHIIYISCNPVTQALDVALLKDKYEVLEVRGFDMFPHTLHMENVLLLYRINKQ